PTWRREASLARCIGALARQRHAPDELVVVTRADDDASRVAARSVALPAATRLLLPAATAPGVIAALQAGLDAATGEIIAFTDDDAEPRADWIERLLGAIPPDGPVAGAGGRDHQPGDRGRDETVVG